MISKLMESGFFKRKESKLHLISTRCAPILINRLYEIFHKGSELWLDNVCNLSMPQSFAYPKLHTGLSSISWGKTKDLERIIHTIMRFKSVIWGTWAFIWKITKTLREKAKRSMDKWPYMMMVYLSSAWDGVNSISPMKIR